MKKRDRVVIKARKVYIFGKYRFSLKNTRYCDENKF